MLKSLLVGSTAVALTLTSTVAAAAANTAPVQASSGVRYSAQAVRPGSAVPHAATSAAIQGNSGLAGGGLSTAVIVVGGVSIIALTMIIRNIAKNGGKGNGTGTISRG